MKAPPLFHASPQEGSAMWHLFGLILYNFFFNRSAREGAASGHDGWDDACWCGDDGQASES